jgi:hypothetical protein
VDSNGGVLTEKRVQLTGNTVDTASAAEPYPTPPWAPEVPNKFPAGTKSSMVLDEGTYLMGTTTLSTSSCGTLPMSYNPPLYVGLQWQGTTEFTVGTVGAEVARRASTTERPSRAPPFPFEMAINDTSMLSITVENTGQHQLQDQRRLG